MKKLVKILVVVLVLALVAVLTLPLTIGPIVKTAASVGGPKALGVPVSVGNVSLNPLAGRLVVSQVKVGNPQGYSDKNAFEVEKVEIGLDIQSLRSNTIQVRKIQIDAPGIVFETKDGKSNFDTILAHAKKTSDEEKIKEIGKDTKPGKKVVIDAFSLSDAKVSYASSLTLGKAVTLPLPSVTLKNIGKASGGVTFMDAVMEIMKGVLGGITQAATGITGAAGDLLKDVGGAGDAVKGAGATLKDAGGAAEDAVKGAAGSLKNMGGAAGGAPGDAVKDAGAALKDAGGAAEDAVKDAAGSLKKLNPFKK